MDAGLWGARLWDYNYDPQPLIPNHNSFGDMGELCVMQLHCHWLAIFAVILLLFAKTRCGPADIFATRAVIWHLHDRRDRCFSARDALLARIGLVNGGEGQLYMGAWLATWGALTCDHKSLVFAGLVSASAGQHHARVSACRNW